MYFINSSIVISKSDRQPTLADRPIRILHIVGGMVRGGIETWLMHVLRNIDRDRFRMDFLVHTNNPCDYDEEIRILGSQIIFCPLNRWNPWNYGANFQHILRKYGPYDIVHSHLHHFSGYVLRLAHQANVPVRIAHSHLDSTPLQAKAGLYWRLYFALSKYWITRHATLGLGCSRPAVAALFTANWQRDPRWQVFYYGIDLTNFHNPVNSVAVRAELGIPTDAFVIGHVGRLVSQKNHQFLLEIAAAVAQREPKMRLLLIGEGILRPKLEQEVARLGLSDRVIFTGVRSDVSRLMRGAMDVFLFPSLYEGLGLVLVEAQAAGLPCIFSDVVPEEADVVTSLVKRLSLSQPASVWADVVLATREAASVITPSEALAVIEQSAFNVNKEIEILTKLYNSSFTNHARRPT
ncbi:glycosyltransferase family 1 protein [Aerosakkonemataceae cyanobacterium BLCC-F154]|uniref:Glycosyltransferase family 1 protein n=1 Tax=Floridaenema fluviatile BLCC-F154 TaxID=3153640 RepID=A0ABV4Y6U4_9CYAN